MKRKWYQETVAIILFLIFLFPVGLFLMWKYANWKKWIKVVLTVWIVLNIFLFFCSIGALINMSYESTNEILQFSNHNLCEENNELNITILELQTDLAESEEALSKVTTEFNDYKERMQPFEDLEVAEAEARKIEADKIAKEKEEAEKAEAEKKKAEEEKAKAEKEAKEKEAAEKKKAEEEKKAKEKEAAEKKAEEERKAKEAAGYETGITYDQLARTPDDYMGEKVKFTGRIIQVMENGDGTVQIRLAVKDDYDTVLLGEYDSSITKSRFLDDDMVTICGMSVGTITYESTLGGNITIPGVLIDSIELK